MGLLDGLLGGGLNIIGGMMANNAARARQNDAQEFSAQQYATRYQTQVKDLEAAGLNPMLAYASGPGAAPTGTAAPVRDVVGPAVSSVLQSRQMDMMKEKNDAEIRLLNAQALAAESTAPLAADGASAEINLKNSSAARNYADENRIKQESQNLQAIYLNVKDEGARIRALTQELVDNAALARERAMTETQVRAHLRAQIEDLGVRIGIGKLEMLLRDFDVQAAEFSGNFGRKAHEFRAVTDVVGDLLKTFLSRRGTTSSSTVYSDQDGVIRGGSQSTTVRR